MHTVRILALAIILLLSTISYSQSVIINEFMSSNRSTIADENGDYEDWIELYNTTNDSINLEGWGLSDNESKPYKWVFPNITIAPNDYLLLFASGKDLKLEPRDGVYYEKYEDIQGGRIEDLINDNSYPEAPNKSLIFTDFFEAPYNQGYYFGHRLHGVFVAPQTGYYTFWLASDDYGVLYLSEDETSENLTVIASVEGWTNNREWDKYSSQQSEEIYLEEDKEYYLLAIGKQANGGDNLAVGWQLPNDKLERPIPTSYFKVHNSKELHTNFSLAIEGEPIILTDKHGNTVDYISEISLYGNISYGLKNDGSSYGYFTNPTPGSVNNTDFFEDIWGEEIHFSHKGGFYNEGFYLTLSSDDPEIQIYYTLDGSEPNLSNLNGTLYSHKTSYPDGNLITEESKTYLYENPIYIDDISSNPYKLGLKNTRFHPHSRLPFENYFKGVVVRAKTIKEKVISPMSYTHSYFISNENYLNELPIISIAVNAADLFDYNKGIYVAGKIADDWWTANPSETEWHGGRPANYNQRGIEWEKLAHIEYFENEQHSLYNHNLGIRIHGGATRSVFYKSLRLYPRSSYGDREILDYPFFKNLNSKKFSDLEINKFKRLNLRNAGNDYQNTLYRDALMHNLVEHLPFTTQAYQPIIHFINGKYWGIINMRERYDKNYRVQ